jgi:hypothetical protein
VATLRETQAKRMDNVIPPGVQEIAQDALFGALPVVTAEHLRNEPNADASGSDVDNFVVIGSWEGRLRQKQKQREPIVAEQAQAQSDVEFAMRPYGFGVADWKKIRPEDRLRIAGQEYDVVGDDDGRPGALALVISLVRVDVRPAP